MSENQKLSPVRAWLCSELSRSFPNDRVVIQSNTNEAIFKAWTDSSHQSLLDTWKKEAAGKAYNASPAGLADKAKGIKLKPWGTTTTCNAFLGVVVRKIRAAGGLANPTFPSFDLPVAGRNAWYWYPTYNREPKSGDFFQVGRRNGTYRHVGVILNVEGGIWTTIESGQGGPNSAPKGQEPFDSIKRKHGIIPHGLMGWIDIDEFFQGWRGPGV